MTSQVETAPALHMLLARVVDYAGLFPPASLNMADAVRAYAEYRDSPQAWALGRFILPASRLGELDEVAAAHLPTTAAQSWALSAVLSGDVAREISGVDAYNELHRDARRGAVHVDTVELKASSPEDVLRAEPYVSGRFDAFIEVPSSEDPAAMIDAIARIGAKAKIRTGGVTPEAFPPADHVVRFMRRCLERGVAFKATAGLHHATGAEYRLTYADDAPTGFMFGFLNLFVAAAFMRQGLDDATVRDVLESRTPGAIRFDGNRVRWRDQVLDVDAIHAARIWAVAFGSCSFREPADDLRALGLA